MNNKHPLLNQDSTHYKVCSSEAIELMELMYTTEQLKAWAEITAMKYRLRIGKKDNIHKEMDKIRDYDNYYRYLQQVEDSMKTTTVNTTDDDDNVDTTSVDITRNECSNTEATEYVPTIVDFLSILIEALNLHATSDGYNRHIATIMYNDTKELHSNILENKYNKSDVTIYDFVYNKTGYSYVDGIFFVYLIDELVVDKIVIDYGNSEFNNTYKHLLVPSNELSIVEKTTLTNNDECSQHGMAINFLNAVMEVVVNEANKTDGQTLFLDSIKDIIDSMIINITAGEYSDYEVCDFWYDDTHFLLDETYYISDNLSNVLTIAEDGEAFYKKHYIDVKQQ